MLKFSPSFDRLFNAYIIYPYCGTLIKCREGSRLVEELRGDLSVRGGRRVGSRQLFLRSPPDRRPGDLGSAAGRGEVGAAAALS